jgi:hypothetical protein
VRDFVAGYKERLQARNSFPTLHVVAKRVRSFNYLDLHDEEFEELTFLLGHLEEPDLIKPANPDLGLDGVVLGKDGRPAPRGLQAKHFTRAISWPQCRKSLDDAVANYRVEHVTFTFPFDLTGKQIPKFREELADRHPGITVDFWGASQLTAKLLGSNTGERIARHIFGDDEYERMSRLIRAGRDLDTGGQAVSVLGATSDLMRGDPYFDYSAGTRPASVPSQPPAEGVVMRVEVSDEHGVHHIDAYATPAAIAADRLPKGTMQIAGKDSISRFQEFLRTGGKLELEGVSFTWENRPKYLEELLGRDVEKRNIVLESLPVRRIRVEFDTTTGQLPIDFEMRPTPPPRGWEFALVGERGGTTMQMVLRRRGKGGEMNLNWKWRMEGARSAAEHLEGLKVLEAARGKGQVRIIDPDSGKVLSSAPSPEQPVDERLNVLAEVLENIATLEQWLGEAIEVPEEISGNDAAAVHHAVKLIEGIESSWTDMKFTLDDEPGTLKRLSEGGVLQVRRELSLDLFGRRYDLGEEADYVSDFKLTSSTAVKGCREFVLRPATAESKMLSRLERPKSVQPGTDEAA